MTFYEQEYDAQKLDDDFVNTSKNDEEDYRAWMPPSIHTALVSSPRGDLVFRLKMISVLR